MGLLDSMAAGALQGAGEAGVAVGKQWMAEDAMTRLKQMEAEIQQARDARLEDFQTRRDTSHFAAQEKQTRLQDELRRAPAKEAMAKIEKANAPVMVDDYQGGGMMQAPTKAEQRANMAKGLIESGDPTLMSAGAGMTENDLNRADRAKELDFKERSDERKHQDVIKRLDQQFEHQKRQDSIAAGNAARQLAVAEEQIRGIKLDNEQKQQLSDLDKQWREAKDDKEREQIAQRRALLTGKWNESFEVKTGKDALGNDTVLGYIDKRRGTFTAPDGTVTDMRTGRAVGGEAKPQWNPSTGDIRINGEIIGKAKTQTEAVDFARKYKPNAVPAKAAAAPAAGGGLVTSPAPSTDARSRYLKALGELNAMKGGMLPTPERGPRSSAAIKAKEEEVNRLLQETY